MSFQKEIRALQSQIDLNTNELNVLDQHITLTMDQIKHKEMPEIGREFYRNYVTRCKRRIKQLAENQRVLKSIIGEYIRMDRVFKE